jgi:hypothetical protein
MLIGAIVWAREIKLHDQQSQISNLLMFHFFFRSRIHERGTISLRFLGIILEVFRLLVSVYNVYITNQFQKPFLLQRGRGVKSVSRGDC